MYLVQLILNFHLPSTLFQTLAFSVCPSVPDLLAQLVFRTDGCPYINSELKSLYWGSPAPYRSIFTFIASWQIRISM